MTLLTSTKLPGQPWQKSKGIAPGLGLCLCAKCTLSGGWIVVVNASVVSSVGGVSTPSLMVVRNCGSESLKMAS